MQNYDDLERRLDQLEAQSNFTQKIMAELRAELEHSRYTRLTAQLHAEALRKAELALREARNWPLFTQHEARIAELMRDYRQYTLREAYNVAIYETRRADLIS